MKKLLLILMCALTAMSASADVKSVYVNPLVDHSSADNVVAGRLYRKALLGLTKAKTISISTGENAVEPGSEEAKKYDYILTIDLVKAEISEAGTVGNLINALSSSKKQKTDWEGKLETEITIRDAASGDRVFHRTLTPVSTDKNKELAIFQATNNFDYDITDMTDDAFRIEGEIMDATEVSDKGIVRKARVTLGSKDGARRGQAFEIIKVSGTDRTVIGAAKCEQVLNTDESVLSISGKKNGDKTLSDLIQNNDGTYAVVAKSCARSGFLHDNFQSIDKMFTKEGRLAYMDPFGRTSRPKVAFLTVAINDSRFFMQAENFEKAVLRGMEGVPTIDLEPKIYASVEEARSNGVDGLVAITIDKKFSDTEYFDGKTDYSTDVLYTIAGIDVANNKWIDMKSFDESASSTEGSSEADAKALDYIYSSVRKFFEDIFPVTANIINAEEVKKNAVKKVRIDKGTDMGLKKGMAFDIYEQRAEGGADSRYLLGEGKVEKKGLTGTEAILNVKGKNNGDERLFELLQNMDENTNIVLISKASYDIFEKSDKFFIMGKKGF